MKVLVTSGPVFGQLDDNKIISNLARGIWASRLCEFLSKNHTIHHIHNKEYWDYRNRCMEMAKGYDAAIMTAAVLNYIPEKPFIGKMPTDLETIDIKLIRSPYVIDEMRKINPKLKLIGCKLTSRESIESTIEKAQKLMSRSKAHAVVANDKQDLKLKLFCFPDGTVIRYNNDFDALNEEIRKMIVDEHFSTDTDGIDVATPPHVVTIMDTVIDRYHDRFVKMFAGGLKYFGSIAVRCGVDSMFVTPREKSKVSICNCLMAKVDNFQHKIFTSGGKATANAPLLWDMLTQHGAASAVVHLHEELPGAPVFDYAPPGTVRDSNRGLLSKAFNIKGHGFVACVNKYGDILD